MGDLKDDKQGLETGAQGHAGTHGRRWIFSDFIKKGVWIFLTLSLVIFALYMGGSVPDPGFSDRLLLLLLWLLRFASLLLCAFSLFALGFSVRRLVYHPSLRNVLRLLAYFLTGIFGAGLAMLHSLAFAFAGGIG
jgi:hypothetical protein